MPSKPLSKEHVWLDPNVEPMLNLYKTLTLDFNFWTKEVGVRSGYLRKAKYNSDMGKVSSQEYREFMDEINEAIGTKQIFRNKRAIVKKILDELVAREKRILRYENKKIEVYDAIDEKRISTIFNEYDNKLGLRAPEFDPILKKSKFI